MADPHDPHLETVSKQTLAEHLDDPDFVLVDMRSTAEYNGWQLKGEPRGGHIRGAVNFPETWLESFPDESLKQALEERGVISDKKLVLYGYTRKSSAALAERLRELGCSELHSLDCSLAEWAANPDLPMDRLVKFEQLVHPAWVHQQLFSDDQEPRSDRRFEVYEVGWRGLEDYYEGHIPGAIYLEIESLERPPSWNQLPDEDLEKVLVRHGITADTTVIIYGRDTMPAARAACILMYAGVEDVRLLDGGLEAWESAGYQLETAAYFPDLEDKAEFGAEIPKNPWMVIGKSEVEKLLKQESGVVVSTRSLEEYEGEISGYDYIQAKGHIQGAVWGGTSLKTGSEHQMKGYRNPDGTMLSYPELAKLWRQRGITPDKTITFYCGTGWRASEAFFYAYLMGWENISMYDGGWLGWVRET